VVFTSELRVHQFHFLEFQPVYLKVHLPLVSRVHGVTRSIFGKNKFQPRLKMYETIENQCILGTIISRPMGGFGFSRNLVLKDILRLLG
jgi:hypothetical protein